MKLFQLFDGEQVWGVVRAPTLTDAVWKLRLFDRVRAPLDFYLDQDEFLRIGLTFDDEYPTDCTDEGDFEEALVVFEKNARLLRKLFMHSKQL